MSLNIKHKMFLWRKTSPKQTDEIAILFRTTWIFLLWTENRSHFCCMIIKNYQFSSSSTSFLLLYVTDDCGLWVITVELRQYSWIRLQTVSNSQGCKFFCAQEQIDFFGNSDIADFLKDPVDLFHEDSFRKTVFHELQENKKKTDPFNVCVNIPQSRRTKRTPRALYHFKCIVTKRSVYHYFLSTRLKLKALEQRNTLRFASIRLQWKTSLRGKCVSMLRLIATFISLNWKIFFPVSVPRSKPQNTFSIIYIKFLRWSILEQRFLQSFIRHTYKCIIEYCWFRPFSIFNHR